ncbi:hypothetical protein, partial [Skermanella stibiiresistens]|uniref:hypothetical protein n=1 Tax=Skermanella stibiiresistens TaxID=913326 RepID=UPI0012F8FB46
MLLPVFGRSARLEALEWIPTGEPPGKLEPARAVVLAAWASLPEPGRVAEQMVGQVAGQVAGQV